MSQSAHRYIGLVLAFAVSGICLADPSAETRTMKVHLADLNLHSRDGVAVAYRRLDRAAGTLCSPSWHARSLGAALMYVEVRECKKEAIASAVKQVNAPLLTAYFLEKTEGKLPPVKLAHEN